MGLFLWAAAIGFVLALLMNPQARSVLFAAIVLGVTHAATYYKHIIQSHPGIGAGAGDSANAAVAAAAAAAVAVDARRRAASLDRTKRLSVADDRTAATDAQTDEQYRERSGYLTRKARSFPWTWDKRYFQLHNVRITYWESQSKAKYLGDFDCAGCVVADSKEREHAFQIITATRKTLVTANNAEDKRLWMEAVLHNVRVYESEQRRATTAAAARASGGRAGSVLSSSSSSS